MLVYKKYIIKSIISPFLIITFVLTGLVWITQMMRHLYLLDKGIAITDFLKLVILIIPSLLFSIIPIVTLIAVLFTYQKLSEERQLIILKTSGLDELAIAKPALTIALLITFFSYFISAYLMPVSYNNLKNKLNVLRNNYVSSIVDVRKFNQVSKHITVYVDKKDSSGNPGGIVLFDNTDPESRTVFFAKKGNFHLERGQAYLELSDGIRQAYDSNNNLTRMYFDNLNVRIENDQNDSENRIKNSLELFLPEMLFPEDSLPEQTKLKLKADGHQRIIWPMFNYVFSFLMLSFFLKKRYSRKFHWYSNAQSLLPVILVALIHFTLQKFTYSNFNFIFLCYANVIACIIFCIWQCKRKVI